MLASSQPVISLLACICVLVCACAYVHMLMRMSEANTDTISCMNIASAPES